MHTLKFKSQLTFASLLPSTILTEISENRSLLQLNSIQFNSKGHGLRFVTGKFLFSRSKFMISLRTKCACIRRTVHGFSQKQNSMHHKSLYEYMLGDCQWRHVALRHGAFAFPGNIDFAADDHCIFMYYSWKAHVFYSSIKQCKQLVNHEQFPIEMTQNNEHNKWLEILDFQPKLLWRTPTKIHCERRKWRQQEAACKAQRTSYRHSKGNVVNTATTNMYRGSKKILQLHCKWSRWREGTPTADASKSDGEIRQRLQVQFTVKIIIFFDATIGSNSYTICTMHVKNIFLMDWGQPTSLYTMSNICFMVSFIL